ncbi:ankyrin repeat domain-containing protein [Ottowia testudinis]|uniref:Ankyrin repeat domain-containing protein n=1 Tax=Ottowia testudinis TaxID=2816950 RepID=A0A975CHG7_9BURK|nr:ankyrin repeat domain-containing protein [Ottowia testudinis]QTD46508.1 ankyrin repeat domain-containing protein [Ottowia testudinis]
MNGADGGGRTALVRAARRGDVGMARLLLAAGADPRRPDRQGASAIDHARQAGHEALARHLEQAR